MKEENKEPTERSTPPEAAANETGLSARIGSIIFEKDGKKRAITGYDFIDLLNNVVPGEGELNKENAKYLYLILYIILKVYNNDPNMWRDDPKHIAFIKYAQSKYDELQPIKHLLDLDDLEDLVSLEDLEAPEAPEPVPFGLVKRVDDYVISKGRLDLAAFGKLKKDNGEPISIVSNKPGKLSLWQSGHGKNKKEVVIYTQLIMNEEALKAAGVTIGKHLSDCAREVYGAMLSHYLAGNKVLTIKMLGKIIFNVSDSATLTEKQKQYIINGANEVFSTSIYINTTQKVKTDGQTTLAEECNVSLTDMAPIFPGHFCAAYINGVHIDDAIELYDVPGLYKLQKALQKGQILRAPVEILAIPGRVDEDLLVIRAYLLRRVDAMKHSKNLSQMIIFKNILDEVGVDTTDRAQRNKPAQALKRTERILTYWKDSGYISDYEKLDRRGRPVKKGGTVYEIQIKL